MSEGPVLSGQFNEVSDSGLIQTNRGGLVSSQDPGPLPVPLPWEWARVTEAMRVHSIHPLLPLWKSDHSHTLIPIAPCTFLVTGKASLAFREMPLCVALCRRSCAGPARMIRCWGRAHAALPALKKTRGSPSSESRPHIC